MSGLGPCVYIPHMGEPEKLLRCLASIEDSKPAVDVVVVDNASTGATTRALAESFPRVELIELGENLGFGRALNLAVARHPGDPVIVLNNDVECRPGFVGHLTRALEKTGAEMLAAVLLRQDRPDLIDSAGVVADQTLMGFDYLCGEPAEAAATAPDPLGPTGGAALYTRAAFEAAGGFDERIFLYYEDLDLALRIRANGGRCRLVPEAVAIHAYSSTLGARNPRKHAQTGWSRGYMLRRYGVTRRPRGLVAAVAREGAICAGQILMERTAAGLAGRLKGWHAARGLPPRIAPADGLITMSLRETLERRRRRHSI